MWGLGGRREKGRTLGNTFCKKKKADNSDSCLLDLIKLTARFL